MLEFSLFSIIILVLVLPMVFHFCERNLEAFLFIMGVLAVTFSHLWGPEPVWSLHLIEEALVEPIMITSAVIIVGLLVYFFRKYITNFIVGIEHKIGLKLFCFALVTILGLISSVITAIMAAIILVEVISALNFERKFEIKLVILGCISIGLGAALTPIGEPLSTICVAKLRGEPYNADFFFLLRTIGAYIIPGVISIGILSAVILPSTKEVSRQESISEKRSQTLADIFYCGGKIYLFIMALIFLGAGFKYIIDTYIIKLPSGYLYWINTISAILDNATLTAAEISPKMSLIQIKYILMGLLVAGGMLIPGNIPNIISAGKLGIKSKEWAKIGVPLGFIIMVVYFIIFEFIV